MHIKALHIIENKNLVNLTLSFDREYEYFYFNNNSKIPEGYSNEFNSPLEDQNWYRKIRQTMFDENFYNEHIVNLISIVGENGMGKSTILETLLFKSKDIIIYPAVQELFFEYLLYISTFIDFKFTSGDINHKSIRYISEDSFQNPSTLTIGEIRADSQPNIIQALNQVLKYNFTSIEISFSIDSAFIVSESIYDAIFKNRVKNSKSILNDADNYIAESLLIKVLFLYLYKNPFWYSRKDGQSYNDSFNLLIEDIKDLETLIDKANIRQLLEKYEILEGIHEFKKIAIFSDEYSKLSQREVEFVDTFATGYINVNGTRIIPSSGEISLSVTLYNLSEYIKYNQFCDLILLDEPDIAIHPEWQRKYLSLLIEVIEETLKNTDRVVQIIFTTHSPIMLSDLHQNSVIRLQKLEQDDKEEGKNDGIIRKKNEIRSSNPENSTFAANIFQLYKDEFFMKGMIGEFAENKIKQIMNDIIFGKSNMKELDIISDKILREIAKKQTLIQMSDVNQKKYHEDEIKRINDKNIN